jgi:anti-sigma factor RsiW
MTRSRERLNEDIQAYLDNELDAVARDEIQTIIDADEDLVRLVNQYRQNDVFLKQLDIATLEADTPKVLENIARGHAPSFVPEQKQTRPAKTRVYYIARNLAATAVLLIAGFSSAQLINNPFAPKHKDLASTWIYRAVGAHKVYTQDAKRPVEIPAERPGALRDWISNRIGAPVRDVRLDGFGYRYSGGRLVTDGLNPAGQLQFAGGPGRKITIFVRRNSGKATSIKMVEIDGIKAVLWSVGQLDYAVIGQIPEKELFSIARANGG